MQKAQFGLDFDRTHRTKHVLIRVLVVVLHEMHHPLQRSSLMVSKGWCLLNSTLWSLCCDVSRLLHPDCLSSIGYFSLNADPAQCTFSDTSNSTQEIGGFSHCTFWYRTVSCFFFTQTMALCLFLRNTLHDWQKCKTFDILLKTGHFNLLVSQAFRAGSAWIWCH